MIPPCIALLVAQGFGTGRIPVAPGTFGSAVGLAWFTLLAWPSSLPVAVTATAAAALLAVPVCHQAETLLQVKDPGSVVLDEIVAVPLCYLGWWIIDAHRLGHAPNASHWWMGSNTLWLASGFVLFRLLDSLKPPPVGLCQRLPGGWGIVADDLAAGLLTGAALGLARWIAG